MQSETENKNFEQVVRQLDPENTLLEVSRLKGGVSANVTLLKVATPNDQEKKVIIRLFGGTGVKRNPHAASNEFNLLQALHTSGVRVQRPVYFDESGKILPTPFVVLEYVEGKTEFTPKNLADFLSQMATNLSLVHEVNHEKLNLSFLPKLEEVGTQEMKKLPAKMDESLCEGRIRSVLEEIWPIPTRNKDTLLHGDYWPGNILWQKNKLAAIIDWEDAMIGDPIADLAISRLELMMGSFGTDAMDKFTESYKNVSGVDLTDLPYWDLYVALRPASKIADWAEDEADEKAMREGHKLFVEQAFEKI